MLPLSVVPAAADLTAFLGRTTTPENRNARGLAIGTGLVIVGFEFEYSATDEDLTVPPGSHTIWLLPTSDKWTLIVSKEPNGFHTNYNPSADLGSLEMTKRALDAPVEQLTFAVEKNAAGRGGRVVMSWETTEASVPFAVQ